MWSRPVAPRAYWKGYLKLSLVSCPIALFPATSEREKISFHQVNKATGKIAVRRVVCAHDCGLVVNPDGLRNQVEGNILQTLSRTLHEEVTFDRAHVTSVDWRSYPLLTFPEVPAVQVALIDQLVEWRDAEAAPRLEKLRQTPNLNPTVRQRADWAISKLN